MRTSQAILAASVTLLTLVAPSHPNAQPSRSQVGTLNCTIAPSLGFIVVSQQRMNCRFSPSDPYPPQHYVGVMTNVGVELGFTAGGALAWAVFSQTMGPPAGGLAGTYVGASGEITVGVGGGANVLIGGSARSIALQPFSIEGSAGLNLQLGISGFELTAAP
jgi:hypothetical protein